MDTKGPPCFATILSGGVSSSKSHSKQDSELSSCDASVAISTTVSSSEGFSHFKARISETNEKSLSPSSLRGPLSGNV